MRENGGDAALIVGAEAVDGRACGSSLSKRMQGGWSKKKNGAHPRARRPSSVAETNLFREIEFAGKLFRE
jgi:hypothetical protein